MFTSAPVFRRHVQGFGPDLLDLTMARRFHSNLGGSVYVVKDRRYCSGGPYPQRAMWTTCRITMDPCGLTKRTKSVFVLSHVSPDIAYSELAYVSSFQNKQTK